MDALKFAFEVLIVGALALPWLAVLIQIFAPSSPNSSNQRAYSHPFDSFLSVIPLNAQDAVKTVLLIAVGYLLGSAVSRISRNLFDDELWGALPTESQIRDQVYFDEFCNGPLLQSGDLPELDLEEHPHFSRVRCNSYSDNKHGYEFDSVAQEIFRLQEGKLLLNGEDKVERLKAYYDQIDVLRGASLNGMIVCILCLFVYLGNVRSTVGRKWSLLILAPAIGMILYGLYSLFYHFAHSGRMWFSSPPLAELVLLPLGFTGLYATWKPKKDDARFHLRAVAVSAVLTMISYGGWCWTEVIYDLHVIHSVPVKLKQEESIKSAVAHVHRSPAVIDRNPEIE